MIAVEGGCYRIVDDTKEDYLFDTENFEKIQKRLLKMNGEILKNIILECCNDIVFRYNDKPSGITATVTDYKSTYQVWHGDQTREYDNVDALMADKFYSGKSLDELIGLVEFSVI